LEFNQQQTKHCIENGKDSNYRYSFKTAFIQSKFLFQFINATFLFYNYYLNETD